MTHGSRLWCGCAPRAHHAHGLCRQAYDRRRRSGQMSPCDPPGVPQGRIQMCGCATPHLGGAGVVCIVCGHENLAALLEGPLPVPLLPAVAGLAATGAVRIL